MFTAFNLDWVEHVLAAAVEDGASDIHIDPVGRGYEVRMRKDGDLHPAVNLLPCDAGAVQRIKVLAEMDIAERRLPQDGSFQAQTAEGQIDIRVASLPTVSGEKIVMRLLRHSSHFQDLHDLQMSKEIAEEFQNLLNQSHGMIVVTGPTGSGKTTTLLSAVRFLTSNQLNIVTLEDPVESRIPGISQVQINERAGLTFAKGLRSILRQDPDVIMVGEIRDQETAEIAVRAALTGHLVMTTMHTDTMEGALVRLVDLGVEPYLVSAAVKGIMAQRLVKSSAGGRRAIFDFISVSEEIQQWLLSGAKIMDRPKTLLRNRLESTLRELITRGEVLPLAYKKIGEGESACLLIDDGKVTGGSPDFSHDWPDSYAVDLHSTQA